MFINSDKRPPFKKWSFNNRRLLPGMLTCSVSSTTVLLLLVFVSYSRHWFVFEARDTTALIVAILFGHNSASAQTGSAPYVIAAAHCPCLRCIAPLQTAVACIFRGCGEKHLVREEVLPSQNIPTTTSVVSYCRRYCRLSVPAVRLAHTRARHGSLSTINSMPDTSINALAFP